MKRRYKCKHCDKTFATKQTRDNHQMREGINQIYENYRQMRRHKGPAWEKWKEGMNRYMETVGAGDSKEDGSTSSEEPS